MKALVLSGGGSKGRYELGALKKWMLEDGVQYDIITGVSVGALNGAFLAQYKIGQEPTAWLALNEMWSKISDPAVYRKWPIFGELAALWKQSVYDSTPLQNLVRANLDPVKIRSSGRKLRVGAVGLSTGEYRAFPETYTGIVDAVLASSSFPAMLTPIKMEGQLWTDGGVRSVTPLKAAIDLGADDIDVILCSSKESQVAFPPNAVTLKIAMRCIEVMGDQIVADDFKVAEQKNALLNAGAKIDARLLKLRLVRPATSLIDNSLDFDPVKGKEMFDRGYNDAQAIG
jgi:NTE family protein